MVAPHRVGDDEIRALSAQQRAELAAHQFGESLDGDQELPPRRMPGAGVLGDAAAADQTMNMRVDDTHAHNTLSPDKTDVQVFYPFHPLHGATLQILRRPKRGDGAVCVMDPGGRRLKIPVWMLSRECAEIMISERPHLGKEALLSLASLIASQPDSKGCVHDDLLQTPVSGCEGGHRGATPTSGPDDSKRNAMPCQWTRRHAPISSTSWPALWWRFFTRRGEAMTEAVYSPKIKPEHLARKAIVYLRQSSDRQVTTE